MLVRDMESLNLVFTQAFKLKVSERMAFPEYKIKAAFLDLGDTQLEVIQPTALDSPFARQ